MILVTGANGHLGSATIDFILQKNPSASLAALVREPAKGDLLQKKGVEIRIGDYLDYASLQTALKGVDTLVFISSGSITNRVQQHTNVVEAAKENGVQFILYTSFLQVSQNTPGIFHDHYVTEAAIKASGIMYTILRNTFYDTALPMLLGDSLKTGQLIYPSGNAKINLASRTEMAEATATIALNPAAHANKMYEITSGKAYSFAEIATLLSEASGKQITYTDIPLEAMKEGMKNTGMPEHTIGMIASIAETISKGYFDYTDPALENLLQRKPVDLKDTIAHIASSQAGT